MEIAIKVGGIFFHFYYLGQNVPPDITVHSESRKVKYVAKQPNFITDSGKVRGYCPVH